MARWALAASAILIFVGVGAVPSRPAQDGGRIGFVNTDIILRQTPGFLGADSVLAAETQSYEDEVAGLQQQLDSTIREFDRQSIALSPTARQEKTEEIRQMQTRFQQRYSELQQRAQERRRELVTPLEERIQTVIDGVRAERNLWLIFDVASPGNNIVSADRSMDLTAVVVRRLRGNGSQ
jgi:outer membrane protein